MPMNIGENIHVTEFSSDPPEFKIVATRRQSRMTQFISKVKDGDEEMTDIERAINKIQKKAPLQKNRKAVSRPEKKIVKCRKKLTLVWKPRDSFITAKTPQACLQELIDQKMAQKMHTTHQRQRKLHLSASPKHSSQVEGTETGKKARVKKMGTDTPSHPIRSDKLKQSRPPVIPEMASEHSIMCPTENGQLENLETAAAASDRISGSEHESLLPRIDDKPSILGSVPSVSRFKEKQSNRGRRFSKNLFSTKKGTGNEECYMYVNSTLSRNISQEKTRSEKPKTEKNVFRRNRARNRKMRQNEEFIPELKNRINAEALVKAFISEQFLNMHLQGPNSETVRKLYSFTIMQQQTIASLIVRHPEILPTRIYKDLIAYKKLHEVVPVYVSTPRSTEKQPWRDYFIKSLSPKGENMLEELENEIPLYANFYKNLIKERAINININSQLVKERRKTILRDMIVHITLQLHTSRHTPGSTIRFEVMSVMAAAAYNDTLLIMLAQSVDSWLDQLAKGLGSSFKSIREETCQILCYMTMCYPLMRMLYISKYFDVVHDLVSILLRSMENFEDTFDDYYITIVHLMHHTPSRGALDCIFDRLHLFKCVKLVRQWPRLTYYAFKYWPDDPLGVKSPLYGKRVVKALENAIQKPVTQKFARQALFHFQLRYNNVSRILTAFSEKAEKAYMVAFCRYN